jgi:hypothetical protein
VDGYAGNKNVKKGFHDKIIDSTLKLIQLHNPVGSERKRMNAVKPVYRKEEAKGLEVRFDRPDRKLILQIGILVWTGLERSIPARK